MINKEEQAKIKKSLTTWSSLTMKNLRNVTPEDLTALDAIDLNWCFEEAGTFDDTDSQLKELISLAITSEYEALGYQDY